MTTRPKLEAALAVNSDANNSKWPNGETPRPVFDRIQRTGSNENLPTPSPQVPQWLANRNLRPDSAFAANANEYESRAEAGASERDWHYNWEAAAGAGQAEADGRGRLFLPRNAAGAGGRKVARRLLISAACLAVVAAAGGSFLFFSGKHIGQTAPVAAQIPQKKVVAAAKPAPNSGRLAAALPAKSPPAQAAPSSGAAPKTVVATASSPRVRVEPQLPSPNSARWAASVPTSGAGNAQAGQHSSQQVAAAYASAKQTKEPPASAAPSPIPAASNPAVPKADESQTASIPNEQNAVHESEKAMEPAASNPPAKEADKGGSRAFITTAANLRASAENHSHVIAVVPARAAVALFSCSQWCKIAYDGHEGYVYKEFVSRSGHIPPVVAHEAHHATTSKSTVASAGSGKVIGGVIIEKDAATVPAAQPAAPAATPQAAQPATAQPALPPTMSHVSR